MDLAIESSGNSLGRAEKKRKREKFKKELTGKTDNFAQLLSMCYEECDGHVSSGAGTCDDDIDDDGTNKYLKRIITNFQTLMGRGNITKDKNTNFKVNEVQVTTLQALMVPQPLLLQKWMRSFGYLCMEARSNVDDVAHQIRKLHDDDVRNKHSTAGATKFRVQFRKGAEDKFPEESTFVLETVAAIKEECSISISNCIGMTHMLHCEK